MGKSDSRRCHGAGRLAAVFIVLFCLTAGCRQQVGDGQSSSDRPNGYLAVATQPATQAARPRRSVRKPPPGAADRAQDRAEMVRDQLSHPADGRQPIRDEQVLEAMRTVPRHLFMPESLRRYAYADSPAPIGEGQTISQPYIVALMTEAARVGPGDRVLEIGTGSGYQAAVLAQLGVDVYTIEIVRPLAERARQALRAQGYQEVHCRTGDGYKGWPQAAPFDAIIITCAADEVPAPLWEQLAPGGRLVMPLGRVGGVQDLILLIREPDGSRSERRITPVRFVPMTRE